MHVWVPYESFLSSTVFANVPTQQKSSEALSLLCLLYKIIIIMMYDNEKWWKSFTTFRGSMDPEDPQLFYKTFISPFNCTSSQRRLNNKYPRLHHLGHWSELNQAFKPSPPSSSVLYHVRAPGSALHHLKSPWDFLINATGFKWSPDMPWCKVQPVSPEVAHFALQENSPVTKPVTLCSLIAPLGMKGKRKNEG